jgi:transcriptional regulator with XRE-family HTH domain
MMQAKSGKTPALSLRAERLCRGWSQTRVTMLTGIAQGDLSAVERGLRHAHPGWRRRIADAFGLPESTLFQQLNSAKPNRK